MDDPPNSGLRRRRSAQSEHGIDLTTDTTTDGADTETRERTPLPGNNQRRPSPSPQRVRFSIDTESDRRSKRRKSDEEPYSPAEASAHATTSHLSVDAIAAIRRSYDRGTGSSSSSPKSPTEVRRTMTTPRAQPPAPKTRNRGMSLRSSLFMRNMNTQPTPEGHGAIEMNRVEQSSSDSDDDTIVPPKGRTSISITEFATTTDRDSSPPEAQKPGRISLGTSALPEYQRWAQRQARRHLPVTTIKNAYNAVHTFVLRSQEIPPSKDGRHIEYNPSRKSPLIDERTDRPYISNLIRSSKYTPYNFVPRQLFAQFGKIANFYFLIVSILQMIPGLSTTGTYTTIIPLLVFVSISMAKEGYEDVRRYRLDKVENNRQAKVLHVYQPTASTAADGGHAVAIDGPIHWASTKWHNVQVGDVVKLERDDPVPADILLLGSKGANNTAYVETMALDGETNLKNKQPVRQTIACSANIESLAAARMHVVVEDPNLDLYNFEGRVTVGLETAPLTNNEIIYRGSVLRNTPEAYGLVIYSGEECKIRMNATKNPRIKAPSLQAIVNKVVVIVVCFVIFLALFNTIAYQIWNGSTESKAWYLTEAHVPFHQILVSFIIMFNTMIPLSLYVSMEIIKLAQLYFLNDIDMYDPVSDTPFEARTSTINEELGQVSYIFSDKTGTLTENIMTFRKLSVAGTSWLHDLDLKDGDDHELLLHKKRRRKSKGKGPLRSIRKSLARESSADNLSSRAAHASAEDLPDRRASTASQWKSSAMPSMPQTELSTSELIRYIQLRPQTLFSTKSRLMLLSMALCHTCLPERLDADSDDVSYQASSPDELALVRAAKELGFMAWERDTSTLTLKTYPHGLDAEPVLEHYEILDVIEFSSKRKRMSVLVRFPDSRIAVICKGADSLVMQRLRLATLANQKLAEIEKRDVQRKSIEAEQALLRKSHQLERQGSVSSLPRASISLGGRRSITIGRPSIGRLAPIRDEVDGWLKERERDVDASPRMSSHFAAARPSAAYSEYPASAYSDFDNGMFPDDAAVMDEAAVIERCFQQINDFATEGLRTLLYGYRFLEDGEYQTWKKVYHDATTSLVDRQLLIERAGELIERQLELGGATAIEDKLQKGVPETIDRLRRGNIKMWMLTGDKRETAINIGNSCRLIKDYSCLTVLDYEAGDVEQNIAAAIIDINGGGVAHSVVVVDGQTLSMIESDPSLHDLFLDLAILADSVICCRASPSQKAGLVSAVRRKVRHGVTLAIGDGANDIAMIQEAHVGIGITGKEGLQAARTSDYAIAQFRFLTKLLLVHGRWNYIRTCKYTVGTFWKEMLFYLTQALYQRSNGYTGTSLYEQWSLSMFNTLFTSLVVIFLGVFEQDLRSSTLVAVPELYSKGQRSQGFNIRVYLGWMFMAAAEACMIFYIMKTLYGDAPINHDNTVFPLGDLTFTACVIVIAMKLQVIEQRYKSITAVIAILLSVGGWFVWNLLLSGIYPQSFKYAVRDGLLSRFGRQLNWWLVLALTVVIIACFEVAVRAAKCAIAPTDADIFQTLEQDRDVRRRFEEASAPWMQAGWDHGTKKSSIEIKREADEQARREVEVQELLMRPRVMEEGKAFSATAPTAEASGAVMEEVQTILVEDGPGRRSTDIQEMLSRRFGRVKKEDLGSRDAS